MYNVDLIKFGGKRYFQCLYSGRGGGEGMYSGFGYNFSTFPC